MKSRKFQYGLFGKVTAALLVLLLCAPLFAAKKKAPAKAGDDAAAYREGLEIFHKLIEASGGDEVIRNLQSSSSALKVIRVTDTQLVEMDALAVMQYPDKSLYKLWPKRGMVLMTVDGKKGWSMVTPRPMEEMSPPAVEGQLSTLLMSMPYMLRNIDKFKIKSLGEVEFYKKKAIKLHITGLSGKVDYFLYVDPKTYYELGSAYYSASATSDKPQLIEGLAYDHKKMAGIMMPTRMVLKTDGVITMGYTITEYKVNIDLPTYFFRGKH